MTRQLNVFHRCVGCRNLFPQAYLTVQSVENLAATLSFSAV